VIAKVDLFDVTYSHFEEDVLARVRLKTFGEDFGQNSWTTADEYRRWSDWLGLDASSHALEVASGSGGPAIHLAKLCGGRVTGIDVNAHGVAAASRMALTHGLGECVTFREADANAPLPFPDRTFDALLCVDSANHFPDRLRVLKEWHRILKPGAKLLFTDPVVVTGPVSNEELAARSCVGYFLFVPPGINARLIKEAGFELMQQEDVTDNAAVVSKRWHDARWQDSDALIEIEGEERYLGLQQFFSTVHRLTSERRLSRVAYMARKREAT
jgi:SAM-dependent methyltransferase